MSDKLTGGQLRMIWMTAKDKGLDEDTLRALVNRETGSTSISKLTKAQAAQVINAMAEDSVRSKRRHANLDGRPNMATGAQARKIEAMWAERSRADDKAASLREFLRHKFTVEDLRFLSRRRASDVIHALEKMEVIRASA